MSLAYRKSLTTESGNTTVKPAILGQYSETHPVSTVVELTAKNSAKETRTNQQFKKSCDINQILARFKQTGVIDHVAKYQPEYGEMSSLDFEEAFNTVKQAEEMFEALPSDIRRNFHNKPENFLAYMEHEENRNAERLLSTSASRNAPESSEESATETSSESESVAE